MEGGIDKAERIGHRAEGRRGKSEGGKEAKLRDGEAEESGELGEHNSFMDW